MLTKYKVLTTFKRAFNSSGYETIAKDIKKLYGINVNNITKLGGYGNKVNFLFDDNKNNYILKVKFAVDELYKTSLRRDVYTHLNKKGFLVPKIFDKIKSVDEQKLELTKYLKQRNLCDTAEWDLLSFVPGRLLAQYKFDKEELHNVLYNLGRTVAFKHEALKKINNAPPIMSIENHFLGHNCVNSKDLMYLVYDIGERQLLTYYLDLLKIKLAQKRNFLTPSIIHSDLNEFNITINSLSNARQPGHTSKTRDLNTRDSNTKDSKTRELSNQNERSLKSAFGFFDFEYCHRGYAIFDVAILMAYSALFVVRENSDKNYIKLEDPWGCANSVLAGYASKLVVNPAEADMLVAAVAGRFCASYLVSKTHPEGMDVGNPLLNVHSSQCILALRDLYVYEDRITDMWKSTVL